MRRLSLALAGFVSVAALGLAADSPTFVFPQIARHGGVVHLPKAAEPPRRGAKLVFDITADSQPSEVNKGLESVARYLNLHADAGHRPADVKLALVLHGGATKAALHDAAYAKHTAAAQNPNLELIRQLKACGVEVFVCGQSLARNNYVAEEVAGDLTIAVSAMTVNANRQQDGYAYIAIPR
jgi:intracellular sulfur oxidation DsrE/DsrF family protein